MRRALLLPAIVLVAVAMPGCRPAAPTLPPPEPTATLAPTATAMPSSTSAPTATATPSPTAAPTVDAPFVRLEGLWGLSYLPAGLHAQALDERLLVFTTSQGTPVAAVDSYRGDAGTDLLTRAREALAQAFGPGVEAGETIAFDSWSFWQTGLRFNGPDGLTGQALYTQPDRDQGSYRVYGLFCAWGPSSGVTQADLDHLGVSFIPVAVRELVVPGTDEHLRLAHSNGSRMLGGLIPSFFVAVYNGEGSNARRIAYDYLDYADYLRPSGIREVQVCDRDSPTRLWLEVETDTGAHSACYALYSYYQGELQNPVSHCHSSHPAAWLADIDGDGSTEVILDDTEDYVFCYACSVRYPHYRVLHCDGSELVELSLTPLPETAPAELRRLGNRAVVMAEAGLWKDAEALTTQASALGASDPTWLAQAALIRLHADAFRVQAEQATYPLLEQAFYGDYAAALDLFRPYSPEQVWGPGSPLVVGTVAEGWEGEVGSRLQGVTTRALQAEPDLAAAWYLRGWAAHLLDPADPQTLPDIRRAAELAPEEPLFAQAVAYLEAY